MISRGLQQFLNGPDVVCQARLHGGCYAERLMHATEVEKGHVEVNGSGQMLQRLAESKAQPRKAPQVCPNTEIGSLNVGRADVGFVRVAADDHWNGCHHASE